MGLRNLPSDFPSRLRAGRAYINLNLDEFALLLDVAGASSRNLRRYEGGETPPLLSASSLVQRLAEVTGLPEAFFWGEQLDDPTGVRLSQIETQLRVLRATVAALGARLEAHDEEARQLIQEAMEQTVARIAQYG